METNMNLKNTVSVGLNNTMEAEDAARILGCSYPHISMLLRQGKIKGQKIGKKWFVDSTDVQRAKSTKLVTPRPRKNKLNVLGADSVKELSSNEVEISIRLSKDKYQLLELALRGGSQKNLKQHLEDQTNDLFDKVQEQVKAFAI